MLLEMTALDRPFANGIAASFESPVRPKRTARNPPGKPDPIPSSFLGLFFCACARPQDGTTLGASAGSTPHPPSTEILTGTSPFDPAWSRATARRRTRRRAAGDRSRRRLPVEVHPRLGARASRTAPEPPARVVWSVPVRPTSGELHRIGSLSNDINGLACLITPIMGNHPLPVASLTSATRRRNSPRRARKTPVCALGRVSVRSHPQALLASRLASLYRWLLRLAGRL